MLKLGIIGTNIITDQMLDAARKTDQYVLTSVYSRSMKRAKEFGEQYDATEFFDDLEKFFEEGDFDVVYIASPNSEHYRQARMAIENDKFIIVEKPAFVNPGEFSAIESLLAAHPKARLVEAARHIHTPLYIAALKKVDEMKKDYVQGGTFTVMKYSSRYDKVLDGDQPYPNIFTLKYAGGALMDLGVYAVYAAVTMFGQPKTVVYYPTLAKTGVDAKGVAILNYEKFTVALNIGKTSNSYLYSEVYGLKDTLVFDSIFETKDVTYYDSEKRPHRLDVPVKANSMIDEMSDFAKLFNDPDNEEQMMKYKGWLDLARMVNAVMYSLRQSAQLEFPADKDQE